MQVNRAFPSMSEHVPMPLRVREASPRAARGPLSRLIIHRPHYLAPHRTSVVQHTSNSNLLSLPPTSVERVCVTPPASGSMHEDATRRRRHRATVPQHTALLPSGQRGNPTQDQGGVLRCSHAVQDSPLFGRSRGHRQAWSATCVGPTYQYNGAQDGGEG